MQRRLIVIVALAGGAHGQSPVDKPTFAEHIAPLVYDNCTVCHRPGQAGPFPLITYGDIRKRARTIERTLKSRYMPPWHPVKGHGEFLGERRLSDGQIALFSRWIETGRSEGDPAKTPAPPKFKDGWHLGDPDIVLDMPEAFRVPKDGPDLFRSFPFRLDLPTDKWVKAIELRPSARSVVHHAIFYLARAGEVPDHDADGRPGVRGMGFRPLGGLGGYVPGAMPAFLPDGIALALPKHTDVIMQTHFHPSGKEEWERSKIAIWLADEPPKQQLLAVQVPPVFGFGKGIDIPAGEASYRVTDSFTLPVDVDAWIVGGHAHYICKSMKMTAKLPSGEERPLLYIDDWDLEWQGRYRYKKPVFLPKGTVITSELVYDNSAQNPENPNDPPERVRWGRESTDEMGSVTLRVTCRNRADARKLRAATRAARGRGLRDRLGGGRLLEAWVRRLDANGDGKLQESEVPERSRERLMRLDRNGDGVVDAKELAALRGRSRR